ncbi:thioredoxin family protein [Alginatibacterium sediminis]|uniref:Thioredoxin family protein n=1 Tax=Alginatibacterium sediminis TaxID=2164068 RepID=A0A420ECT8_9ALTE|nr:thioredoxin family protein [Alginatibacterium sediminis]RKF18481.1 thioredoxin family protein [Alginatibacterium sediminis]
MRRRNLSKAYSRIGLLLLLLAMSAAAGYIYLERGLDRQISASDGWFFDLDGYYQALRESKLSGKPMLIYVRRKACQRCLILEKELLNEDGIKDFLQGYVKVRVYSDQDRASRLFSENYPSRVTPVLYVQDPMEAKVSTHLLMAMDQIWVANDEIGTGNFMHLSPLTLRISIDKATLLLPQASK